MRERQRRMIAVVLVALVAIASTLFADFNKSEGPVEQPPKDNTVNSNQVAGSNTELATSALKKLDVKGRAPRTGYEREQFGAGWAEVESCDMRNYILQRDLENEVFEEGSCIVLSGTLNDPYTAKVIRFQRGETTSDDVQIDHVVALSDAWQKGAQQMDVSVRTEFANDPLNLLAVDGPTNNQKSGSDAASLLPPNKDYRCRYVARQIAVKVKYDLWITTAEKDAMNNVLSTCPTQTLPIIE